MSSIFSHKAAHLEQSHVSVEIKSSESHIPLPASHLARRAEAGVCVGELVTRLPEGGVHKSCHLIGLLAPNEALKHCAV